MTLTQLEKYMISEIENLHIKMDEGFEAIGVLVNQVQRLADQMTRALDTLDNHDARIAKLESK